jgi:hypothetical protein
MWPERRIYVRVWLRIKGLLSLSRFAAVINDSNLIAIALFCVIGLVMTAVFMLRWPDLGAIIAQYNHF